MSEGSPPARGANGRDRVAITVRVPESLLRRVALYIETRDVPISLRRWKSWTGNKFLGGGTGMARSDLLVSLVRAGASGDSKELTTTVEAIIAEERAKQHNILKRFPASMQSRWRSASPTGMTHLRLRAEPPSSFARAPSPTMSPRRALPRSSNSVASVTCEACDRTSRRDHGRRGGCSDD